MPPLNPSESIVLSGYGSFEYPCSGFLPLNSSQYTQAADRIRDLPANALEKCHNILWGIKGGGAWGGGGKGGAVGRWGGMGRGKCGKEGWEL